MEFNNITKQGAIDYLSSYIEDIHGKIEENHPQKRLYEEQVLFFSKALELLKA